MCKFYIVEALVCGHPREAIKVSVIGAGRLRKSKNTEFVWDLSKGGFVKVAVRKAVRA